ncbi:carboxypeptidase-like protein [Arcticibacter tournemirensis]|uniref:Alpha-2-macroglobulin domain-containing protein n=1 Tax=Arcticibacter tournemirensis TaxID=699437 RepID=A0A5M9HHU1_9SPHI|nr:alpha-2-macroglobulin family protein [Arcticibacter tournemirensis]KAA8484948.1 hypothetical protein F1649_04715 [Arcticibacter tournemirensis]TQM50611.1 carboxypeptidase-like protein [Arcticibacter tournemirensis]
MPHYSFRLTFFKSFLLCLIATWCINTPARAQRTFLYEDLVFKIDSLANVGLIRSALKKAKELEQLGKRQKQPAWQIKAVLFRVAFQNYLDQDAVMPVIDSLNSDIKESEFPLKPVLQSVLAQTYWRYYQVNRYRIRSRSHVDKVQKDIATWGLRSIADTASKWFKESLSQRELLLNTPVNIFNNVLAGDTTRLEVRPTLYDILLHRALDFFLDYQASSPRSSFSLDDPRLFAASNVFGTIAISSNDTLSAFYTGFKLLQQAERLHLTNGRTIAAAHLNMRRMECLKYNTSLKEKDILYLKTLKHIAFSDKSGVVAADALYSLAIEYRYKDSLGLALEFARLASARYPGSRSARLADKLLAEVLRKDLSCAVEEFNLPDENLLASVSYRNVKAVLLSLYKISFGDYDSVTRTGDRRLNRKRIAEVVEKSQLVQHKNIGLPGPEDYKEHRTELKIGPFKPGAYLMVCRDADSPDSALIQCAPLIVSNLAFTTRFTGNEKWEILVADRKKGHPLASVIVSLDSAGASSRKSGTFSSALTDKLGKVYFAGEKGNYGIQIVRNRDTLVKRELHFYQSNPHELANPQTEFLSALFTDRKVYRPGQIVYFRGIEMARSGDTSALVSQKTLQIELRDANNGVVDKLDNIITNEFGSFSGAFILPEVTTNGPYNISTGHGVSWFRVEEYKRPTYSVKFSPVEKIYRFNDSVTVRGHVQAYASYGISNARISYKIERSNTWGDYHRYGGIRNGRPSFNLVTITTDSVRSNNEGEFTIPFRAKIDKQEAYPGAVYTYNITVTATSPDGETRSSLVSVTIGDRAIRVAALVDQLISVTERIKIPVSLSTLNGRPQAGKITAELYQVKGPEKIFRRRFWSTPDLPLMKKDEFERAFPSYSYRDDQNDQKVKKMLFKDSISITEDQPAFAVFSKLENISSGYYLIRFLARNVNGDTTSAEYYTTLLSQQADMPAGQRFWTVAFRNTASKEEDALFFTGFGERGMILKEMYNGNKLLSAQWLQSGKKQTPISVAGNTGRDLRLQFLSFHDNRVYQYSQNIDQRLPDKQLNISLSAFNEKLTPGGREHWRLKVTGKDGEPVEAELLAAMYDMSIDQLNRKDTWSLPVIRRQEYYNYFSWDSYFTQRPVNSYPLKFKRNIYEDVPPGYIDLEKVSVYTPQSSAVDKMDSVFHQTEYYNALNSFKKGFNISGRVLLEGNPQEWALVKIRGSNISVSTNQYGYFKIRVPSDVTLDISFLGYISQSVKVKEGLPVVVNLRKNRSDLNAEADKRRIEKLPGSEDSPVSRVLSKQWKRSSRVEMEEDYTVHDFASMEAFPALPPFLPEKKQVVNFRRNFNETAFFYPHLKTNQKGEASIEFTVPESLTRWKLKIFAHTRNLASGYLEKELVTQKELMIVSNLPRFFREDDSVTITARITNYSGKTLRGTAELQLFNPDTKALLPVISRSPMPSKQFEITPDSNEVVPFTFLIPRGLSGITCRINAITPSCSDGEETFVPVLSNAQLVTESLPLVVPSGQSRSFTFEPLLKKQSASLRSKSLLLEYTSNQLWTVIQSLSTFLGSPSVTTEQTFGSYYANTLASYMLNKYPEMKMILSNLERHSSKEVFNEALKNRKVNSAFIEETPWLNEIQSQSEQKKNLTLLADFNRMNYERDEYLKELSRIQINDGSFPWIPGGTAGDRYITQYVTAGIGAILQLSAAADPRLVAISKKAIKYLDQRLISDYKTSGGPLSPLTIQGWYAKSYYGKKEITGELVGAFAAYIAGVKAEWTRRSIYEQAMIALTAFRFNDPAFTNQIVASLKETGVRSEESGMYWPRNKPGHFWYQSPAETQSLLIQLFSECTDDTSAVAEMKTWLLGNKHLSDWRTTKATVAACSALFTGREGELPGSDLPEIKAGDRQLTSLMQPEVYGHGTGYVRASWGAEEISPKLAEIKIKNTGKATGIGAVYWQYLENINKIKPFSSGLSIERKYFLVKDLGHDKRLYEIDDKHIPVKGDLIKVMLYVNAEEDFEYVHLKDLRPSGAEVAKGLSGFETQDGLYYYQVHKDASSNFFISRLPKGKYVLEYGLWVTQAGTFNCGICSIQSMYAPEFGAHTSGKKIEFR